ncbi:terminase small subunit [Marinobacter nauticus]|uniref:Terminase small subunit n=1 Tax=Marinobacter nauticus TaxID=2743 RepID=A0A1M2V0W4_MARNT|nr:terminase small subunit [Marinobacter nauticus]OJT01223.1 terminase small subunit [Marinobacter nauticus]
MSKLTPKQQRFVDEYLVDLNATQAAIRAGYSEKTARQTGAQNLSKPVIADAIQERIGERSEKVGVDAQYVLKRLHEIDQLDIADLLDDTGKVRPIKQWPKAWRTSISGLDIHELVMGDIETIVRKVKWPDKLRNLELIGKHVNVKAFESEASPGDDRPIHIEIVNPHAQS